MRFASRAPALSTLVVALVAVLGAIGAVYAAWSDTLEIRGTVSTAVVDAMWDGAACVEFHTWPDLPIGTEDQGEVEGKDVASFTLWRDPNDPQLLNLEIVKGYPSYGVMCDVKYENTGTIPWKVRGSTIVAENGEEWQQLTNCELTGFSSRTLRCDQLAVLIDNGIGTQIHPGERKAQDVTVHIEEGASQDALYRLAVGFCVGQWNLELTPEQCFAMAQ